PMPIPEVETGNVKTGYVVITPDANTPIPLTTLSFGTVQNGIVQGQAGVVPPGVTTGATFFTDFLSAASRNVGIAIANPTGITNTATITLNAADGSVVGTPRIVSVNPYSQISKFLN